MPGRPANTALIMLVLLSAGAAATAGDFGVDGNYGNASGCAFLKSGERKSDDLLLLTPVGVESYAALCTFSAIVSQEGATTTIESQCADEGEDAINETQVTIAGQPDGTVLVVLADNTVWGPLERCK